MSLITHPSIYEQHKAAQLFNDAEYKQWRSIIECQQKTDAFIQHVAETFLSIHFNAALDFCKKFIGSYSHTEVIMTHGMASISYFSPELSGVCGMKLVISRTQIEVRRLHLQDNAIVGGVLTQVAVR